MEIIKVISYAVLGILIYSFKTQSCLFGRQNMEYEEINIADEDVSVNPSCDCGKPQLHHVYVNISFEENDSTFRICSGTMVTSNVIVVSHLCIQRNFTKLDVFDNWSPKSGNNNVIEQSNIQIFVTCNQTEGLSASKVIYNYRYAVTSMLAEFPTNAVLLLQVETDLTNGIPRQRPICLDPPDFEDEPSKNELRIYQFPCVKEPPITNPNGNATTGNIPTPTPTPTEPEPPISLRDKDCDINSDIYPRDNRESTVNDSRGGTAIIVTMLDKTVCESTAQKTTKIQGEYPSDKIFCISLKREEFDVRQHEPVILYRHGEIREYLFGTPTGYFVDVGENYVVYYAYAKYLTEYMSNHGCLDESKVCKNLLKSRATGRETKAGSIQQSLVWHEETGAIWEDPSKPISRPETQSCKCGLRNTKESRSQGRIAYGEDAIPHEFSWMTFVETDDGEENYCTGSVINNKIILTAAHCTMKSSLIDLPEEINVFTNVHNRQNEVVPENAKAIEEIVVHPGYVKFFEDENKRRNFDIALLVLKEPLEFGDGFCPICLPGKDEQIPTEQVGVFAGYGVTDPDKPMFSSIATVLQKGNTTVWSREECLKQVPSEMCTVKENLVCTISHASAYPYLGDSGGPLMVQSSNGRWVQLGVCSSLTYAEYKNNNEVLGGYMNTGKHQLKSFIDYISHRVDASWCTRN